MLNTESNKGLPARIVVFSTLVCGVFYAWFISNYGIAPDTPWWGWFLVGLKTLIEVSALFYGFSFISIGLIFLFSKRENKKSYRSPYNEYPSVGIIYLFCSDMDKEALQSVSMLNYPGKLHLVIHDDSMNPSSQEDVDSIAEEMQCNHPRLFVNVLRREDKRGGKSGAVNYVLKKTANDYEYFILCDNDSKFLNPDIIQEALDSFSDNKVAINQFRIIGIDCPENCTANRYLRKCIDVFHVFMSVFSHYGWQPFIGHNAMLRTRAVMEAGGWTPGFFSDDLDLTVRLNLKGYKVLYTPDIVMGEKHPPSYDSFRARAYKWAYGCMQTAREHLGNVLRSNKLNFSEKTTFIFFIGFYFMQGVLLFYLFLSFFILPFTGIMNPISLEAGLIAGTVIVFIIFLPFLAYFIREERKKENLFSLLIGGMVYGTSDFSCIKGITDCLMKREKKWIPTNGKHSGKLNSYFMESVLGISLLIAPLYLYPSLFFLPCTYLFAGKFLFTPMLHYYYDNEKLNKKTISLNHYKPVAAAFLFLLILITSFIAFGSNDGAKNIELKGKDLYVNEKKFYVKGIHYGPWRSGTGPNKHYDYPSPQEIDEDFKLISKLHANTVLVYDAPSYLLDIAEKYNLSVIYTFSIYWYGIDSTLILKEKPQILEYISENKNKPAVLAWILGNEIPEYILTQKENHVFEAPFRDIYKDIKKIDSVHPVTHSNWPPARSLNLNFFDIISFNVYPVWPIEVVTQGYGNYINNVIAPIAGEKPLLITEFGVNSLEATEEGQARIVKDCWNEILNTQAIGGVVFAFSDEWWKNYDNPIRPENYWFRTTDTLDEKTHDLDPEEYYGIMTAYRQPKPAYFVVQEMFSENIYETNQAIIPKYIIITLILIATAGTIWAWKRSSIHSEPS